MKIKIKYLIILIMPLMLAACGGGSSSTSSGNNSTGGNELYTVRVIEYIGDEIVINEFPAASGRVFSMGLTIEQGMYISGISGCGGVSQEGPGSRYVTDRNITSDCTIEIIHSVGQSGFSRIYTEIEGWGGSISPKLATVSEGNDITFSIPVREHFTGILTGCGVSREILGGRTAIITLPYPNGDCTLLLSVQPDASEVVQITTSVTGGGNISPSEILAPIGSNVQFRLDAGVGYDSLTTGCGIEENDRDFYWIEAKEPCNINTEFFPRDENSPLIKINHDGREGFDLVGINESSYMNEYSTSSYINFTDNFQSVKISLIQPAKYTVSAISGCGIETSNSSFSLERPDFDCEISIELNDEPHSEFYEIKTIITGNGSVTPETQMAYNNSTIQIRAEADKGYVVDGIYTDEKCGFDWRSLTGTTKSINAKRYISSPHCSPIHIVFIPEGEENSP